jgi:rRNA maturation endonuclease Nob1
VTDEGLHTEIRRLPLADLKPQPRNARYMRHEQFQRLVANLKRDGVLTSVPLVDTELNLLSGHHRVKAALEAGIVEADVMVAWRADGEPLTRKQIVGLQLSHNSIAGEDDPATLKELYQELTDVESRSYSGLDDKTLKLLSQVDVGSLSEPNLDYTTVQIVFLPDELTAAEAALKDAKRLSDADVRWMAGLELHEETLAALAVTSAAYQVGNVATALGLILDVFRRHMDELREGWLDDDDQPRHDNWVPLESILGVGTVPSPAAAVINRAVEKMVARSEVGDRNRWQALEMWAADYLQGPE